MTVHHKRRSRLRDALSADFGGVFVTRDLASVRYLTGFSGSNATVVIGTWPPVLALFERGLEHNPPPALAPERVHDEVHLYADAAPPTHERVCIGARVSACESERARERAREQERGGAPFARESCAAVAA